MVGDSVEGGIGVHVGGWIHEGSRSALDLCIVALSRHVLGNLFHVRFPIDLGVCKSHESRSASSAHFVAEGRLLLYLQGTFQMIRAQRTASRTKSPRGTRSDKTWRPVATSRTKVTALVTMPGCRSVMLVELWVGR